MKNIISFLFLIISGYQSVSQGLVSKARIETSDGRSIQGYIKKPTSDITPQSFEFSINGEEPFEKYQTAEIRSIYFGDGNVLERYFININTVHKDYLQRVKEDYSANANEFSGEALVERVLSGAISLYVFYDRYHFPHFFFKDHPDTALVYLPYRSYKTDDMRFIPDPSYKNLLHFLARSNNCEPALEKKISGTEYQIKPMLAVLKELNQCLGTEVNIKEYRQRTSSRSTMGLFAGASYSIPWNDQYSHGSLRPTGGLFVNVYPRKSVKSYYFSSEIQFHLYKCTSDTFVLSPDAKGYVDLIISSLHVNPHVRYFFNKRHEGLFLHGGGSLRWLIRARQVYNYQFTSFPDRREYADPFSAFNFGFTGGVGYAYKHFAIETRYSFQSIFLMARYTFRK